MNPFSFTQRSSFFRGILALSLLLWMVSWGDAKATQQPVKNLEKAVKSGKKEILFEGKENEDLTIKKGMRVIGTHPSKAIIYGDIILEDGASLMNITVSGKDTAITIAKGASATLQNVTVRNGVNAGVYSPYGSGTLTIKNSNITKNRKGLYILPGKTLNISGSLISENKEEGLDVRGDVSGTVVGNRFQGNGEGGAEIIAGDTRMTIEGNVFSQNGASGLAFQFYTNRKTPGLIQVNQNTFSGNGNFGIVCKSTLGGSIPASFFAKSVRATGNTFQGNKLGIIEGSCGFRNQTLSVEKESEPEGESVKETTVQPTEEEIVKVLDEKSTLLFTTEHALELSLHETEVLFPRWQRWFIGVPERHLQGIEESFQSLDVLRQDIIHLSPPVSSEFFETKRANIIEHSFDREEELWRAFEELHEEPRLSSGWLLFF